MKGLLILIFTLLYTTSYGDINPLWDHLIKFEGKKIIKEPTGDYSKYGLRSFFIKEYNKKYYTNYTIKSLNEEQGKKIFEEFFYKKYLINGIENENARIIITDTIYNQGIAGIILIQKSINKSLGEEILKIDGVIGAETINALNKIDFETFKKNLKNKRIAYYKTRKHFKKYGKGWLNRLDLTFNIN